MSSESSLEQSLTVRQRYWLGHLRAWREAGGSLKAYALEHDVPVRALYSARQCLRERGVWDAQGDTKPSTSTPTLVAVRVKPQTHEMCRIRLLNGVVVEVPEHADVTWCATLVRCVSESTR